MTAGIWSRTYNYLKNAEVGKWARSDKNRRAVEVVDMVGGRFLLIDGDGLVETLTNDVGLAVQFLTG